MSLSIFLPHTLSYLRRCCLKCKYPTRLACSLAALPQQPLFCSPLAARSGLPEAIICILPFHMQIRLPSASSLPRLSQHLRWRIAVTKRCVNRGTCKMLDLENGHFTEACAVRCMSKHFRRSGEREAHCAGAGVCSLLFAVLVPILSLSHTPGSDSFLWDWKKCKKGKNTVEKEHEFISNVVYLFTIANQWQKGVILYTRWKEIWNKTFWWRIAYGNCFECC